ncbi:hypothetical protein RYX36_001972, partial [Vicia faba]
DWCVSGIPQAPLSPEFRFRSHHHHPLGSWEFEYEKIMLLWEVMSIYLRKRTR